MSLRVHFEVEDGNIICHVMKIRNKLTCSRGRQQRTTHYPNENTNPTTEQASFYKHIPCVILPSSICRSRSPSRCHGDGSCKGLWLAHSICPFSGSVARRRASLSLPWFAPRSLSWASSRIWRPLFDSTDRRGRKNCNKIPSFFLASFGETRTYLVSLSSTFFLI